MTRFLIDEDVNQRVIRRIPAQQKGFDIIYPEGGGYKGFTDKQVRDRAIEKDGVLVTLDEDFAKFQLKPGDVPRGVLWIRGSHERVAERTVGTLLAKFCQFTASNFPDNPYDFEQKIIEVEKDRMQIHTVTGVEEYLFPQE
jgi:predicted nuclease of predicted toxin-antitoxin system